MGGGGGGLGGCATPEGAASQWDPHRDLGLPPGFPWRSGASTGALRLGQGASERRARTVPLGCRPHVTRFPDLASRAMSGSWAGV